MNSFNIIERFSLMAGDYALYIKIVLGFLVSFLITYYTIPRIIGISRKKNLMDEPGHRSSHQRKIPNLGGVAIFYAVAIAASIFAYQLFDLFKFLFASLIILLFIGVMDDIVVMRAYKKFFAQVIVSFLMVIGSDVRIRSMFGLFGIYELPFLVSVIFSMLFILFIINAFNLIDGIDGLAGSNSVLTSLFFGISFFRLGTEHQPLVILCAIIIGSCIAFLRYNLGGLRNKKIFMGDTGSMILGFLQAFLAILFIDVFIDMHVPGEPRYHLNSALIIAFAILIIPISDTVGVIIKRIIKKQSPFIADNNHLHHSLLKLGLSHRSSTAIISVAYVLIVGITYLLRHINNYVLLLLVIFLGALGILIPEVIRYFQSTKSIKSL